MTTVALRTLRETFLPVWGMFVGKIGRGDHAGHRSLPPPNLGPFWAETYVGVRGSEVL